MSSAQFRKRLTKHTIESVTANGRRFVIWDSAIPGFGLTVSSTGAKSFILRYRPGRVGRSAPKRFVTIGRFGPVTPEQARKHAIEILGEVAKGKDPAAEYREDRETVTVADAAQQFMSTHVEHKCKRKTQELYRYAMEHKIIPAFGKRKLLQVSRIDVANFHHMLRRMHQDEKALDQKSLHAGSAAGRSDKKSPAARPSFFNSVSPTSYFAGVFFATKPSSGL
jgi:hypothetical protein